MPGVRARIGSALRALLEVRGREIVGLCLFGGSRVRSDEWRAQRSRGFRARRVIRRGVLTPDWSASLQVDRIRPKI